MASENASSFIGIPVESVLGKTVEEFIGRAEIEDLQLAASTGANPARIELRGRRIDAIVHRDGPLTFVELEPGAESDEMDSAASTYGAANRLSASVKREELLELAAAEFRSLTGFDRVMVYHFHEDGHGEIVAEDRAGDMEPYRGLHFPASDIPSQARQLYLTKLSRAIVSTSSEPVGLLSLTGVVPDDLDLGITELRSVSPFHLQFMRNMGQASSVSFSLVHRGTLIGMITCAHRTERRLPFLQRRGLEVLANQTALQLGSLQDMHDLAQDSGRRELRALLLGKLVESSELASALISGSPTVLDLVDADAAAVRIDGELMRTQDAPSLAALSALADRGFFASNSVATDDRELAALLPGYAGVLFAPVGTEGDYVAFFRREVLRSVRWLGDQSESNRSDPLSPRVSFSAWTESVRDTALPWGKATASVASFAEGLERTLERRREAQLAQLALRDPLTSLPNRRFLQEELERALSRGSDVSLLFIDLDSFKSVNDNYGHEAGDHVLLEVARRVVAQVRTQDKVARLGGDEFVVVCENMPAPDAHQVAERVIGAIGVPMELPHGSLTITASCGIVTGWKGAIAADLIKRSDAAMYRAKTGGRNRVSQ